MPENPLQQSTETDIAYWRSRVSSLEALVRELLVKNQRMRFVLEVPAQERLTMDAPLPARGLTPAL